MSQPSTAVSRSPRRACQDNDFNARNPRSSWIWKSKVEMRAELKRRGLPDTGAKDDLVTRIRSNNDFNLTTKGEGERFERRLKVIREAAIANIVPFHLFQAIPVELRLMIWELSLPGPRTLCISGISSSRYQFGSEDPRLNSLEFRQCNNPNPAALFVCQESRAVAFKKYRLCFGTSHVYADLAGGDVLFFDPDWQIYGTFANGVLGRLAAECGLGKERASSALADLQLVKRIALSPRMLMEYNGGANRDFDNGSELRLDLKPFLALKKLLLVGGETDLTGGSWGVSGHVVFGENNRAYGLQELEDTVPEMEGEIGIGYEIAIRIRKEFLESATTDENEAEMDYTVPDVRVVSAHRITTIPGDNWFLNRGEPFYLPEDQLRPAAEARRSSRIQRS